MDLGRNQITSFIIYDKKPDNSSCYQVFCRLPYL
jgi:hypothetical protein